MKYLLVYILKFYKSFLSPFLPMACRFTPTCSEYMMVAISKYGSTKGTFLGVKRILRCQPFCKGGFDPVK